MKKLKLGVLLMTLVMAMSACSKPAPKVPVTILYTNDVHTYVNNQVEDADGNKSRGLSYGNLAALKKDLVEAGENVILADAGDHSQGTAYGALDEGKQVIDIMNRTGYDVATLGNHEFDYGQFRAFGIMDQAEYEYLSCTFYSTETNELVLPAYKVFDFDGTKVAVVGISTPETITKSSPAYFMDEKMEKYTYGFYGGKDGKELYDAVQKAIDSAKKEADYVIALGHLGVDPSSEPWTSKDVIANTTGLTAFIDGHSHSEVECETVKDKKGNDVVLTQTGCYFAAVGKMVIDAEGKVTVEMVKEYDNVDETVDGMVTTLVDGVDAQLNQKIAVLDSEMRIYDPKDDSLRIVRRMETNAGDFTADGVYWFFNESEGLDCDVAIANGGGVRANTPAGDVTYASFKKVQPFGNVCCLVEVTGQNILDALEWGAKVAGSKAEDGNWAESGGFLHVAGIKYTIDTSVTSNIPTTEEGVWNGSPETYRVCDVEVYNRETKRYEPLDLTKTYTIGGSNYILRSIGDGMAMFKDSVLVKDFVGEDYLISSAYAQAFGGVDSDGFPHITTENSPLAAYENYLLDYENAYGAGRITFK